MAQYSIEPLNKSHNRKDFSCGEESLDIYIKQQMRQFDERHLARPHIMVDNAIAAEQKAIVGYYTLSQASLRPHAAAAALLKRAPPQMDLPVTLLGRLAVDQRYHGQGLGTVLLVDALKRSLRASREVASRAVIVDALHDRASAFYRRHDFSPFDDQPLRLYITMDDIAAMLRDDEP